MKILPAANILPYEYLFQVYKKPCKHLKMMKYKFTKYQILASNVIQVQKYKN